MSSICRARPTLCRPRHALAGWPGRVGAGACGSAGTLADAGCVALRTPAAAGAAIRACITVPRPVPRIPLLNGQRGSVGTSAATIRARSSRRPRKRPSSPWPRTPSNDRYWLSGQANIIFQGDLPFHSPYEGTNSFRNSAEYKTSLLGTLYTALRPTRSIRYNTDLILDLESSGGRGLSQALGLAGFTNLDVVRNPTLSTKPYLARYEIHQVIRPDAEDHQPGTGLFRAGAERARAPHRVPHRQDDAARLLRRQRPRLRQPPAVHELDGGQQRRMGLRRRHPRLHRGRHGRVRRPHLEPALRPLRHAHRGQRHRHGLGLQPRPRARTASSSCATASFPNAKGATRLLFFANRAHMGNYREAVERLPGRNRQDARTSCFTSTSARSSTASATTPSRS